MRHSRLAGAAIAAAAVSVPVVALAGPGFTGTAQAATSTTQTTARATAAAGPLYNQVAASVAMSQVGDPYAYGGTSPAGFDCSGLTQWVYLHTGGGKPIARMAEDQFLEFRPISRAAARPGDLVFFHETSDLASFVYHVGIYEGGDMMVAATVPGEGVQYQSFAWAGDTVSFGSITH
jgi:cell wall-associated NlpC family hydrolase